MSRTIARVFLASSLFAVAMAQEAKEGPQWVEGNTFHDRDYAFSLTRPRSTWQFLNEERIASILPDACMGAIDPETSLFVGVIVERTTGLQDLEEYERLVAAAAQAEPTERSRVRVEVDGRAAIRTEFDIETQGMAFTFARLTILDRGFGYQVVGWSASSIYERHRDALLAMLLGIRFASEGPTGRGFRADVPDQVHFEWRIVDGRYENAAFAFGLEPPDGWRLMGKDELVGLNGDASLGLAETEQGMYQLHVLEPLGRKDREEYARSAFEMFQIDMPAPTRRREVSLFGSKFQELFWVGVPGTEFDGFVAYLVGHHGDRGHQIHTYGTAKDAETFLKRVDAVYANLTLLDEVQRERVEKACAAADSENAVGPTWALRGGVYRDFAAGFQYRRPTSAWRLVAGEDVARHGDPDATLYVEDPRQGVYVHLYHGALDEPVDLEGYHRGILSSVSEEEVEVERIETAGLVSYLTVVDLEGGLRDLTITTGNDKLLFLISTVFEEATVSDEAALARLLLGGLSVPEEMEGAEEHGPGWFACRRLGFRLEPGEGATVEEVMEMPFEGMESIARVVIAQRGGETCTVVAMCTPHYDVETGLQGLMSQSGFRVDPETIVRDEESFEGSPALRQRWEGRRFLSHRRVSTWILRRGNTFYVYIVDQPGDTPWDSPAWERAKGYLTILP